MEHPERWFSTFQFTECLQNWSSSTMEERQFANGSFIVLRLMILWGWAPPPHGDASTWWVYPKIRILPEPWVLPCMSCPVLYCLSKPTGPELSCIVKSVGGTNVNSLPWPIAYPGTAKPSSVVCQLVMFALDRLKLSTFIFVQRSCLWFIVPATQRSCITEVRTCP